MRCLAVALWLVTACSVDREGLARGDGGAPDGGAFDAGSVDAGSVVDAGMPDAGGDDAGVDAGRPPILVPAIATIDEDWACSATGDLDTTSFSLINVDTDSGAIVSGAGAVIRAPGQGVDPVSGIRFEVAAQPSPAP